MNPFDLTPDLIEAVRRVAHGEAGAQRVLVVRQEVHREHAGALDHLVGGARLVGADEHQGRDRRDAGEGAHRHAVDLIVDDAGEDGDEALDLLVTVHGAPNRLFLGNGLGRFVEAKESGFSVGLGSTTSALADIDRDEVFLVELIDALEHTLAKGALVGTAVTGVLTVNEGPVSLPVALDVGEGELDMVTREVGRLVGDVLADLAPQQIQQAVLRFELGAVEV